MADWLALGTPLPVTRVHRLSAVLDGRLAAHPIGRHPALRVKLGLEGYKDFTFGCRWGPVSIVDALCHGLAHAAEFGPDTFEERCTPGGSFVFREKRVFMAGRFFTEAFTGQMTERECRTAGIAHVIMTAMGVKKEFFSFACDAIRSLDTLPDWVVYHKKQQDLVHLVEGGRDLYSTSEVFDRIEGWLDLTAVRLKQREQDEQEVCTTDTWHQRNLGDWTPAAAALAAKQVQRACGALTQGGA